MSRQIAKLAWQGQIRSVQPRIRLLRSFDQRVHNYLGFVLRVAGALEDEAREFVVAIGKGAQAKHGFQIGDQVSGKGVPVPDPRLETADLYKISGLKRAPREAEGSTASPPFCAVPPALEVYRARGHRRLAARTYSTQCSTCTWGCEMPVEMTLDQWDQSKKRYRRETFCYGPKSCTLYSPGPTRKVPGRNGMSYEEEDWIDDDATAHRGSDE